MVENILNKNYASAINSYTSFNTRSSVIGTLVEKINKNIKLDIGDNRIMDIELREDVDLKVGEKVAIDRSNIAKSRVVEKSELSSFDSAEMDFYSLLLSEFKAELSEENLSALKKMSGYGVEPTRENFESYLIARDSLSQIESSLDYDLAVKLSEQDWDIENESIQSIAEKLKDLSVERKGSELLNKLGSEPITTERAEEIALELYGSRMGKDITDIIKSLHSAGVQITKKMVEKINDVFYKLDKISDISDSALSGALREELDLSIDNLYRAGVYGKPSSERDAGDILKKTLQSYDTASEPSVLSSKSETVLTEEDISDFLKSIDVEPSSENIDISKKLISENLEVTAENIDSFKTVNEALAKIVQNLNYEKAALLELQNINIDQDDIRSVANALEALDVSVLQSELSESAALESSLTTNLESLKSLDEKDVLSLLKSGSEFKLSSLAKLYSGGGFSSIVDYGDYAARPLLETIDSFAVAFRDMATISPDVIAMQIKRSLPMTVESLHSSYLSMESSLSISTSALGRNLGREDIAASLSNAGLELSSDHIKTVEDTYSSFSSLRTNLTSSIVSRAISEDIALQSVEISVASGYVDQYRKQSLEFEFNRKTVAEEFENSLRKISGDGEKSLIMLLKNKKPLLLGEFKKANSLLNNSDQVGHMLSEASAMASRSDDRQSFGGFLQRLKDGVRSLTLSLRGGKGAVENAHDELDENVKNLQREMLGTKDSPLKEKVSEVSSKLEENKRMASEERIVQLPVYMNENFSNLNMFFRDRKNGPLGKSSEDISAILSIQTETMGNLNIGLDIVQGEVSMKIGLENRSDTARIEKHIGLLSSMIEASGYSLGELNILEEEVSLFEPSSSEVQTASRPSGMLDIKI